MPVVINDFEMMSEPAEAAPPAASTAPASAAEPARAPSAHEIEQMLRRQVERALRVRAD